MVVVLANEGIGRQAAKAQAGVKGCVHVESQKGSVQTSVGRVRWCKWQVWVLQRGGTEKEYRGRCVVAAIAQGERKEQNGQA